MKQPFDRVVGINLRRRTDRLRQFEQELIRNDWPFKMPVMQYAIDGYCVKPPEGYSAGPFAWGCLQSHRRAIEDALNDGCQSLLILEDDAILCPDFASKAVQFMSTVPDWDFVYLGGNHCQSHPVEVSPGILKIDKIDRTHAYGMRGSAMMKLYQFWHQWHPGLPDVAIHDWIGQFNSFAPNPWLIGQRAGPSDVCRSVGGIGQPAELPEKWWNPSL